MITLTIVTLIVFGGINLMAALGEAKNNEVAKAFGNGLFGLYLFVLGVVWIIKY